MCRKFVCLICLMTVGLIAGVAQGENLLSNGDFEDDLSLVPNPGDTSTASPTDWVYPDYFEYGVYPWLQNVSAIGDGSGGDVGVVFPNWNDDAGWEADVMTETAVIIQPGRYTVTMVGAVDEVDSTAWIQNELWWTPDISDPWAGERLVDYDYMPNGDQWLDLGYSTPVPANTWVTQTFTSTVGADDPAVGNYLAPWIFGESYDGHTILGEYTVTYEAPEPAMIALLGLGSLILVHQRRK